MVPNPVMSVMKWARRLLPLVGLVVLAPAEANPALGKVEARVTQGELARVSSWWRAGKDLEARWWWEPGRGGSGWVKAGDWQLGPLAATTEGGARSWGPGTRLRSGSWGVSWDGEPLGLWAVQTPGEFEAGLQAQGQWSDGSGVLGADRSWDLTGEESDRWIDRLRIGGRWTPGVWSLETDGDLEGPERGPWQASGGGKITWKVAPWSAEVRGRAASYQPWDLGCRGGWKTSLGSIVARWGRNIGTSLKVEARLPWGRWVWEVQGEGRWNDTGSVRGGLGVSGTEAGSAWNAGWALAPSTRGVVQTFTGSCKQERWEARVEWKTEGFRLGWLGPGSRFDLTLGAQL